MSDHSFSTNPEIADLEKGLLAGGQSIRAANVAVI
mgnify:CR=1 FL=1|jgi:hypothetical protein|tara:strand:- start:714 stop:818 length:105 start_codon:yes stop_codon:yes gene_type:complete